MSPPLHRELELALELGRSAGALALAEQRKGLHLLELREKEGGEGPVTRVDVQIDQLLVDAVARAFPDDAILAEESGGDGRRQHRDRCWMIDPIDGTSDFARGSLDWCILIGLVVRGIPALGVIVEPARARLTFGLAQDFGAIAKAVDGDDAARDIACSPRKLAAPPSYSGTLRGHAASADAGRGAESDEHAAKPSGIDELARMVSSWSRRTEQTDAALAAIGIDASNHTRVGSTGVKLGMIARGEAEVYPHIGPRTRLWDTAGPQAILSSAGGSISDLRGQPLRYQDEETRNLYGLLASSAHLHDELKDRARVAMHSILGPPRTR